MSEDPIRDVYDRIATHFADTRAYPWPEVEDFLQGVEGAVGIDVGCGNGRHTETLSDAVDRPLGIDVSRELLTEAVKRRADHGFQAEFLQGEATTLPIQDATVDVGLYVATIHHLRRREERIRSLDELARVLRADGIALLSTWSTAHDRFDRETGFDTTIDWTLPDGETVPRFYHIYDPAEFRADIERSDLRLLEETVSSGNCYATVKPA